MRCGAGTTTTGTHRMRTSSRPRRARRRAAHGPCGAALLCLALVGCAGSPVQPSHIAAGAWPGSASYPASPLRRALGRYYHAWAGVPYEYGGTTKSGIDCSAFVRQTVAHVSDLSLPRTTGAQVMRGRAIPRSALRTGDLVFFRTGGSQHVGIYLGNGRFMHASSSVGVTISRMNNIYWRRHFWQARRLPIR